MYGGIYLCEPITSLYTRPTTEGMHSLGFQSPETPTLHVLEPLSRIVSHNGYCFLQQQTEISSHLTFLSVFQILSLQIQFISYNLKSQNYSESSLHLPMRVTVKRIMSMSTEGASCVLLILDEQIYILLDCGINHEFNLDRYKLHAQDLKKVHLALISHSSLEYSGAYSFLIQQLNLNPKLFFTTQPIMRYSPLNLHESLLLFRMENYNKKLFNKIYSYYEEMQLVKPYQRKQIQIKNQNQAIPADFINKKSSQNLKKEFNAMEDEKEENREEGRMIDQNNNEKQSTLENIRKERSNSQSILSSSIKTTTKVINFSCYPGGGSLGSISWKINYGLINIIYLVQYNNYSLYHIGGLDLESLKSQTTHVLITDTYRLENQEEIRKEKLYADMKTVIVEFYRKNNLDFQKPRPLTSENQPKLLFTCYPNQSLIEVLLTARKIMLDIQGVVAEKITAIHLSLRYLELIKSQSEYFSVQFKNILEKMIEHFDHSLNFTNRINVTSFLSINGVLSEQIKKNVQIYHVGEPVNLEQIKRVIANGSKNLQNLKIFQNCPQNTSMEERGLAKKNSLRNIEQKMEQEQQKTEKGNLFDGFDNIQNQQQEQIKLQENLDEKLSKSEESNDEVQPQEKQFLPEEKQPLIGKYISQIIFPHFVFTKKEEDHEISQYGLKHQVLTNRNERLNIYQYNKENDFQKSSSMQENEDASLSLNKKQSSIEIMNISFKICPLSQIQQNNSIYSSRVNLQNLITFRGREIHKTGQASSLKIIKLLNPRDVILINILPHYQDEQDLYHKYEELLKEHKGKAKTEVINVYDLNKKSTIKLEHRNQLLEYRVNYIPQLQLKKIQKIKGRISKINGNLHIHLDCLEESEVLEFKLDVFYKKIKNKMNCQFTGNGIVIEGVKLYRKGDEIILEGEYSQEYFKVRKLLYEFLQIES